MLLSTTGVRMLKGFLNAKSLGFLKVCLHGTIVRHILHIWRMKNTADAIIRLP